MKIGVLVNLTDADIKSKFMQVKEYGFDVCQLCCWEQNLMTDEIADKVLECCERYGVRISTFWCGWSGPAVWDFYEGPLTLGIVPEGYRFIRMKELMHGSDFAKNSVLKILQPMSGSCPRIPRAKGTEPLYRHSKRLQITQKTTDNTFFLKRDRKPLLRSEER